MTIEQLKEILKTRMATSNPTEKSLIIEICNIIDEQEDKIEKLQSELDEIDS